MKNQKGITLIALIITIIVMIILVAVSVTVALQSGLFEAVGSAAGQTSEKAEKENELAAGKVTVGGKTYNTMQEYINTLGVSSGGGNNLEQGDVTGDDVTDPNVPTEIAVGDIIAYTPTQATYTVDLAGCSGTFTTEDLGEWKVLSVSGDTIRIMPKKATTATLTLEGANGWNNSINAINGVCGALYGNEESELYTATATGLTVEDVNEIAGYTPTESTTTYSPSDYNSSNRKFPTAYLDENGIIYSDAVDGYAMSTSTEDFIKNTWYSYYVSEQDNFNKKFAGWMWGLQQESWLASRSVNGRWGYFEMRTLSGTGYVSDTLLFYSDGRSHDESYSVRPVASLTPTVEPVYEKTIGEGATTINYWKFE